VARSYALLKSNQVDEASMTDLSRLVFKIIPYDKSEVGGKAGSQRGRAGELEKGRV
jgi:hypothetical protein